MARIVRKHPTLAARSLPRVVIAVLVAGVLLLGVTPAQAGPTPAQKCQAAKNKSAGQYVACRQNAEAKFAASGDIAKYGAARDNCVNKLNATWQKAEVAAANKNAACQTRGARACVMCRLCGTYRHERPYYEPRLRSLLLYVHISVPSYA